MSSDFSHDVWPTMHFEDIKFDILALKREQMKLRLLLTFHNDVFFQESSPFCKLKIKIENYKERVFKCHT